MSSSAMTEAILTVAVVIAASTVAAIFLQNTSFLNNAQISASQNAKDAMDTQFKIEFATNSSYNQATIWIKNTGTTALGLSEIKSFDVFFGPSGSEDMVTYNANTLPSWNFTILSGTNSQSTWTPAGTVEITINLPYTLTSGDYHVIVTSYNGVSADYYFSL